MGGQCCKAETSGGSLPIQNGIITEVRGMSITPVDEVLRLTKGQVDLLGMPKGRKNSLLLALGANFEPKLFVRLFLMYSFYINKYTAKDGKDLKDPGKDFENMFFELAAKSHNDVEQLKKLQNFKSQFTKQPNEAKKDMIVIDYFFNAKFIVENINRILLNSEDPKDVCHLIFPLARISKGIKKFYADYSSKTKKIKEMYIVAVLDKQEKQLLDQMIGKNCCFAFSTFMKGFTTDKKAQSKYNKLKKEYGSSKSVVTFIVNFPYQKAKMSSNLDYGFYLRTQKNKDSKDAEPEEDVLFNIVNCFKVCPSTDANSYDLEYGHLANIHLNDQQARIKSEEGGSAIRVYDVCNALSNHFLKSQSCLFRIINETKQSLNISNTIISHTQTTMKDTVADKQNLTEIEAQNLINNYIDQEEYAKALKLIDKYSNLKIMKAKKIEILYKQEKYQQAKGLIDQFPKDNTATISTASQIVEFIEAKLMLIQASKQQAKLATARSKLKALIEKMRKKYKGQFQVIGVEAIVALQESYGGKKVGKDDEDLIKSQKESKAAIRQSAVNMRGISTTI